MASKKRDSKEDLELLKKKVELLEKEVELKDVKIEKIERKEEKTQEEIDEDIYKRSKSLYKWKAPLRVFVKRDRRWFFTVGFIALLFIFFLVLVDKPLLIAVILAYLFLNYVLSTTKPEIIEHEITNKGIYTLKKLYKWENIQKYMVVDKSGSEVIYVETDVRFVPRLILLVGSGSLKKISELLQKHIPYKYIEKQGELSKRLDGVYIPAKKLPGRKPSTTKGEE